MLQSHIRVYVGMYVYIAPFIAALNNHRLLHASTQKPLPLTVIINRQHRAHVAQLGRFLRTTSFRDECITSRTRTRDNLLPENTHLQRASREKNVNKLSFTAVCGCDACVLSVVDSPQTCNGQYTCPPAYKTSPNAHNRTLARSFGPARRSLSQRRKRMLSELLPLRNTHTECGVCLLKYFSIVKLTFTEENKTVVINTTTYISNFGNNIN